MNALGLRGAPPPRLPKDWDQQRNFLANWRVGYLSGAVAGALGRLGEPFSIAHVGDARRTLQTAQAVVVLLDDQLITRGVESGWWTTDPCPHCGLQSGDAWSATAQARGCPAHLA